MVLKGVVPGDIVRVDGSLAFVIELERYALGMHRTRKHTGRVVISWHNQPASRRTVSAQSVEAHWKKRS